MSKKSVAHKRTWGSSSSSINTNRFVSTNAEAQFHDSEKRRADLKERRFDLDSSHLQYFETLIAHRGWQEFYKPPKAAAMTVFCKFYTNGFESPHLSTTVRERQVRYDTMTINSFLKIQNAFHDPNQVAMIDDTVDLDAVTQTL